MLHNFKKYLGVITVETKILKAIESNKLNLRILGERNWYHYFICVTELVWSRNNYDGYKIDVFTNKFKETHLATIFV